LYKLLFEFVELLLELFLVLAPELGGLDLAGRLDIELAARIEHLWESIYHSS
jgi:hypothetical protein